MSYIELKKEAKKKNNTGSFIKETELCNDKSDLKFIQITSLRMKTLEEESLEEQQESDSNIEVEITMNEGIQDSNIEVEFTMNEGIQDGTGRSELETEDGSYKF